MAPPVYAPFARSNSLQRAARPPQPTATARAAQPRMAVAGSGPVNRSAKPQLAKEAARTIQRKSIPTFAPALVMHAAMAPAASASAPARHSGPRTTIQRKVSVTWDNGLNAYQIEGRPEFTAALKKEVFNEADANGEAYIVKFSDNNGVSFSFPTVHRRHKLAWSLWRAAVNTILANGDEDELETFMSKCFVPAKWKTWNQSEFEDARDDGRYLESMSADFFNHADNLWLGPGDENMGKGGGLDKLIANYVSNPTVKRRKALKESAFDPHNKNDFEYREPSHGSSGGWYFYNIPQTPRSDEMEDTVNYVLDNVLK